MPDQNEDLREETKQVGPVIGKVIFFVLLPIVVIIICVAVYKYYWGSAPKKDEVAELKKAIATQTSPGHVAPAKAENPAPAPFNRIVKVVPPGQSAQISVPFGAHFRLQTTPADIPRQVLFDGVLVTKPVRENEFPQVRQVEVVNKGSEMMTAELHHWWAAVKTN
jgi:hypothetical protein